MSNANHQSESPTRITDWIVEARAGSEEALAELMEFSRKYLLLIANDELPMDLQANEGASDMVQQTQMEAVEAFGQFRGQSASELLAWLRQILHDNVHELHRRYARAANRRVSREISLGDPAGSCNLAERLAGNEPSPSKYLWLKEQEELVEAAVEQLPSDYRQVILWHHRENCSFEEISERLNRSVGAVRKLWARAVQELQARLQRPNEPKR